MRIADDMTPAVFTRRVVGGFVLSHRNRDPPYTVCGCNDTSKTCRDSFRDLVLCKLGHESLPIPPVYFTPLNSAMSTKYNCSTASPPTSFSSPKNVPDYGDSCDPIPLFDSGYEIDGTSADILNTVACSQVGCPSEDARDRPVASLFQSETTPTTVATVWYNNRVRNYLHVNVL